MNNMMLPKIQIALLNYFQTVQTLNKTILRSEKGELTILKAPHISLSASAFLHQICMTTNGSNQTFRSNLNAMDEK